MSVTETYLGDGVYATYDGCDVTLDLRAQPPSSPITRIVLEPSVYGNLQRFVRFAVNQHNLQARSADVEDPHPGGCHHCGRDLAEAPITTENIDGVPTQLHVHCLDDIRNGITEEGAPDDPNSIS